MSANRDVFKGHKYINLETYRKNGNAVRTPVWFAQDDGKLYVWTSGSSGKAKRIRRTAAVRIAPSDSRGNPLGAWIDGEAQIAPLDTPTYAHGNRLMNRKYGLMKKLFELMGRSSKSERIVITIQIAES